MEFSRQEYWKGLPCPPPGYFPDSGIKPMSPALQADSLPLNQWGSPMISYRYVIPFTFQSAFTSSTIDPLCSQEESLFHLQKSTSTRTFPAWKTEVWQNEFSGQCLFHSGQGGGWLSFWTEKHCFGFFFFLRHCFYLGLLCSIPSPLQGPSTLCHELEERFFFSSVLWKPQTHLGMMQKSHW